MTHRHLTIGRRAEPTGASLGPTPAPPTRPLPDIPDEPIPMPMPGDPPSGPTDPLGGSWLRHRDHSPG